MKHILIYCLAIIPLALVATVSADERPAKPNAVLILTDDLGWQDVKCYDVDEPSPMETPNIDALARRGVMFWQAYAPAPTCAPARCAVLTEMKASYPYNNAAFRGVGPKGKMVPTVTAHEEHDRRVTFTFQENGAKVVRADVIYSQNGNARHEEWSRIPATLAGNNTVTAELPEGTTHYIINLIDENSFLVSYPDIPGGNHFNETKEQFAKYAIAARVGD